MAAGLGTDPGELMAIEDRLSAGAENGERWIRVSNPPPLARMRTVSLAPAGPRNAHPCAHCGV
jgi:hypothetical protein